GRGATRRGGRAGAAAGTMMRDAGLIPDRVLCSAALRTRQTWRHVSEALGPAADKAKVSFESRLYDADETALLQAVRRTPDKAGTVLLVGHNPASQELVLDLTGLGDLAFPPSALAGLRPAGNCARPP